MARAPNIKGLIAGGTLAFSRVIVPTHSNQNNMALLTGQYPEGDDVPANSWLARTADFTEPVGLPGLAVGDYVLWAKNPLRTRGDSVYRAVARQGLRSAYVGPLPPFDVGADDSHLAIVGTALGPRIDPQVARALLSDLLGYPADVLDRYHFEGPPAPGETLTHFTIHQAAGLVRQSSSSHPMPDFMFVFDFVALDGDPTSATGADGPGIVAIIEDYDAAVGELLAALEARGLRDQTNIVFTMDHGKVDTHNQVALGTRGARMGMDADGQLATLVAERGGALGITTADYALLNEDGDALIYARVPGAGTEAGASRQADVTHALLSLIQSGALVGVDTTRTLTADGALGTRRIHDFRGAGPNQADIIVFPQDDWTLNQVDAASPVPGPFRRDTRVPYGRHGGFSVDELYVPLFMNGPAFKAGVFLPHPVDHPQVAATALAPLPGVALQTAAAGPIVAALADRPGETLPQPAALDLADLRQQVLRASGYLGDVSFPAPAAPAAVIVDVAGLYDDEVFTDAATADAAAPLRALAERGTRFSDCWLRYQDWPVTEFQLLTGGTPVALSWMATAEDDPAQTVLPGVGLLAMPPAANRIANQPAFERWRQREPYASDTLFDAARRLGAASALIGQVDFHDRHLAAGARIDADAAATPAAVRDFLGAHTNALVVVALGGPRTGDRHSPAARAELAALAAAVGAVADAAPGTLLLVTSRGGAAIDDAADDFYGPGSARHVPLFLVGPNVRAGVVTSQPASAADVPATVLVGLGAPTSTDFVQGTWAAGGPDVGIPQPAPGGATEGRALMRAFLP